MKKKPLDKSSSEGKRPLHQVTHILSREENVQLPLTRAKPPTRIAELKTEVRNSTGTLVLTEQYQAASSAVISAFAGINLLQGSKVMGETLKYTKERTDEQPRYIAKLKAFIAAADRLSMVFVSSETVYKDTFTNENLTRCQIFLTKMKLDLDQKHLKGKEVEQCKSVFDKYANFIGRVFGNQSKLESFYDESKDMLLSLAKNYTLYQKLFEVDTLPETPYIFNDFVVNVDGLIRVKRGVIVNISPLLYNIEKSLLEFRIQVTLFSNESFLRDYFKINRDLINIQMRLLKYYKKNSSEAIGLWLFVNRDILRVLDKEVQIIPSELIERCKESLKLWNDEFAKELLPLVNIINKLDKIESSMRNNKMEYDVAQASTDLSAMLNLYNDEADETCRQNPLLKALVLANIINFYTVKNDSFLNSKNEITLQFVMRNIKYFDDFVDNLTALKGVWGGQLFQFLNNFIFIKNYIQIVISATEHALLICEILFEKSGNDFDLKKQIIDFQISLIEIQNDLLNFINDNRDNRNEKEYVKKFYFKRQGGKGLDSYNVYKVNKEAETSGDSLTVVHGIPVEEVIDRNNLRKLKLEAIKLEFESGHRCPKDSDYANALSENELQKYQEEIDKKRQKKALEEKRLEDQGDRKKKDLRKFAEKNASKAKERKKKIEEQSKSKKDEGKKGIPDAQLTVKTEQNSEDRVLSKSLNQLLLKLNPRSFNVVEVREAIVGLHDMLPQSNNYLLKFQALSGVGDSYSTIVAHDLNHDGVRRPQSCLLILKLP